MEADLQAHVAFFLSGKMNTPNLEAIDRLNLRPALFAGYRDLTRLRYDFPLILVNDQTGSTYVESLSGLIDGILEKIARAATLTGSESMSCTLSRTSAIWPPKAPSVNSPRCGTRRPRLCSKTTSRLRKVFPAREPT